MKRHIHAKHPPRGPKRTIDLESAAGDTEEKKTKIDIFKTESMSMQQNEKKNGIGKLFLED